MEKQQVSPFRRFLKAIFPEESPESLSSDEEEEVKQKVLPALTYLIPTERSIIESLYGLGNEFPYTIDQCCVIHKMSPELVGQNQRMALEKIRGYLEMMYSTEL